MPAAARLLAPLAALALAACATPGADVAAPRPERGSIVRFAVDARVAVRAAERSAAASVIWNHAPEGDDILVTSPLGQGLAELRRDAGGAVLTMADGTRHAAATLDELSAQVFGQTLPLAGMPRWLVGIGGSGAGIELDGAGRPARFFEDGWRVEYAAWESARADALPTLLRLERHDIEVRVKIDRWDLAP